MALPLPPHSRALRLLTVLVCLALVPVMAACSSFGLPIVKIDEAHYTPVKNNDSSVVSYKLAAGKGFILDGTGYTFVIPADADVPGPNMIQVADEGGAVYSQPWDMQQTRYEVSASTLSANEAGEAFPGLVAGKSYMVGVGNLEASGRFVVMWAGIVVVKEKSEVGGQKSEEVSFSLSISLPFSSFVLSLKSGPAEAGGLQPDLSFRPASWGRGRSWAHLFFLLFAGVSSTWRGQMRLIVIIYQFVRFA